MEKNISRKGAKKSLILDFKKNPRLCLLGSHCFSLRTLRLCERRLLFCSFDPGLPE
jgi:hypothetical protein